MPPTSCSARPRVGTALRAADAGVGAERKAEQIASFLGRKITATGPGNGHQFSTRIEGTCIKHRFGRSSIKMYDKFGCVLRIETTTNDVSFFKHHRKVEHRQGPPTRALASVKKTIYSLIDCARSCSAAIGATWRISPPSTTSPQAFAPSTNSPNHDRSTARPSRASTSSIRSTMPCCTPCKTRGSISPASDGPTSGRSSTASPHRVSQDNCAACATSASSSASPEPIAITSPAWAALQSQRSAASHKASSSQPSLDQKICAENVKSQVISD